MKTISKNILLGTLCVLPLFSACNYEEINTNPFEMKESEGKMDGIADGGLVTSMQRSVFPIGTQADDTDVINEYQISYHLSADSWSGYFGQNNDWNGGNNNTTYFLIDSWVSSTYRSSYTTPMNAWKSLKIQSEKNNTPDVYAMAQILRISAVHKTLETFGPIPYSHAGENKPNVPFDSERDVYTSIFKDLTDAIEVLTKMDDNGTTILMPASDAVYGGNVGKWIRYANSLMLRLAIRVRYADEEMAKKYASQALNHPYGVITSKEDEAKISNGAGMVFRNNIQWLADQYNESRMGSSMLSYLVGYDDPRTSKYFKETESWDAVMTSDGKRYQAVPPGHAYSTNDEYQKFSKPNIESGTPTYWLRASEVYFLRAEAALVWGGEFGNPETLYREGIATSFAENGVTSSVDEYMHSGATPIGHEVNSRYSYSAPAPTDATTEFSGSKEQKLEKIMIQKWIALYPNGQEAWTEWRRTGYPKLNKILTLRGQAQGATREGGIRRMIYPNSFYSTRESKMIYDNALKLLNNGAGGEDKSSTRLWWDRKN